MNEPRISKPAGLLMIGIAGLIDFLQFVLVLIPFVGWAIAWLLSIFAWMLFAIWFHHYGVSLGSPGRILGTFGALLAELVPFINAFPWLSCRVFVAVWYEW